MIKSNIKSGHQRICKLCVTQTSRQPKKITYYSKNNEILYKCRICKILKAPENFYNSKYASNKKKSHCIECYRDRSAMKPRSIVFKDGQKLCSKCKIWKDLSYFNKNGVKAGSQCKDCKAITFRYNSYNLSEEEYKNLIRKQNSCAICGIEFVNSKTTHVDHCHQTNKVRGLLCGKCNTGIGQFDEDIIKLQQAIKYLEQFK